MPESAKYRWAIGVAAALVIGFVAGRAHQVAKNLDDRDLSQAEAVVMHVAPPAAESDAAPSPVPADARTQSNAFKTAAARVREAVVFVQVAVHSASTEESILDNFSDRLFRDHVLPRSVGSGVIISPDGYIVTNNHVVEGARQIQVTLTDKRVFDAELVGTDRSTDLAVLRVSESNLPNAVFGNSDLVDIGEWVLAIGNPFRLRSTVTAGIVSAVGRDVDIIEDGSGIEDFIQTDAAINPGNSGGALVNLSGELIGINTAIATESGSNEGYGFAVPSNLVARVSSDLIEFGEVQRGYLGVTVLPMTIERARSMGLDRAAGVELRDVAFGLAAHRAGLRTGDVIISIDDAEIDEPNQLQSAVARRRPGDTLSIRFWRGTQLQTRDVTILGLDDGATGRWLARQFDEPRPSVPVDPEPRAESNLHQNVSGLGLLVAPVGESAREAFGVDGGVYVISVQPDGTAASAGMHADAVIASVDGVSVSAFEDLRDALADYEIGASVVVETVRRDGSHFFYDVEVGGE